MHASASGAWTSTGERSVAESLLPRADRNLAAAALERRKADAVIPSSALVAQSAPVKPGLHTHTGAAQKEAPPGQSSLPNWHAWPARRTDDGGARGTRGGWRSIWLAGSLRDADQAAPFRRHCRPQRLVAGKAGRAGQQERQPSAGKATSKLTGSRDLGATCKDCGRKHRQAAHAGGSGTAPACSREAAGRGNSKQTSGSKSHGVLTEAQGCRSCHQARYLRPAHGRFGSAAWVCCRPSVPPEARGADAVAEHAARP